MTSRVDQISGLGNISHTLTHHTYLFVCLFVLTSFFSLLYLWYFFSFKHKFSPSPFLPFLFSFLPSPISFLPSLSGFSSLFLRFSASKSAKNANRHNTTINTQHNTPTPP